MPFHFFLIQMKIIIMIAATPPIINTIVIVALRGIGDNTVLDEAGFSTFIGASAPIISVSNRLSFVGRIPNENQFLTRIGTAIRIAEEGA
jgi:hypothetical protein